MKKKSSVCLAGALLLSGTALTAQAEAQSGLYPQEQQRHAINLTFSRYFSALYQA